MLNSVQKVYEQVSNLLHMAKWTSYLAKLQPATRNKNPKACLEVLRKVLPALTEPWDPQTAPLYHALDGGNVSTIAQSLHRRFLDDLVGRCDPFAAASIRTQKRP